MDDRLSDPVITVFRSRLRADAEAKGCPDLAARMEDRAPVMPGFVEFKTLSAPDGKRVSIITFDGFEHQQAGRDDGEARLRGRREFYAEYSISVCQEQRLPSSSCPIHSWSQTL